MIILLLSPVLLYSQHFNGGLFGGLVASQISGDRLAGFDKPGLYTGAFVSYNLNPEQSLQMELSFIQKGSRKTPNMDIGDYTSYKLNMNYLEIPVWYRYKPLERIGLEASLSWAYLFNYSEKDENGDIPMPPGVPEFKKYDVSAGAGIFYNVNRKLSMHLRITHSVLPVRPHAGGAVYRLNFGQYHHALMFTLHYQINKPV
jgi:hypothetical protein